MKSLNGLRGLAVLLVLFSHLSLAGMNIIPGLNFSGVGKSGVYLFFVLSAFLLVNQALLKKERAVRPVYWAGYFLRRFFRIYPLYLFVLGVMWVLTASGYQYKPDITASELAQHILLLQGKSIFWTIPVEFSFYFVLPLVSLVLYWLLRWRHPIWLDLFFALLSFYLVISIWPPEARAANSIQLGPYIPIFLWGCFAAYLVNTNVWYSLNKRLPAAVWDAAGALGLGAIVLTIPSIWRYLVDLEITNRHFHGYFMLYGGLWTLILMASLYGTRTRAFFEADWIAKLGKISFSLYLWHFALIQLVNRHVEASPAVRFTCVMILAILIAYGSYRWIERPAIAWASRRLKS